MRAVKYSLTRLLHSLIRGEKGLSFIDTLIGIAVLGTAATAFLGGIMTVSGEVTNAQQDEVAHMLARNQLEYIKTLSE